jgi:hypothetical protein
MTESARTRRLRELLEKWRMKYPAMTAHKQSADDYWAGQCSGVNRCADELAAVLDTEGDRQERANCSIHPTGDHEWVCLTCLEAKDEPSEPIADTEGDRPVQP